MRYRLKNPQVSIYIAVFTYVAMVFCPIQHILEALYHSFVKIAMEACISLYTNMAAVFCFPLQSRRWWVWWRHMKNTTKGEGWGRGHTMISILLEDRQYWMLVRYLAVLKQSVAKQQRVPVPGLHLRPKAMRKRKNKMYLCRRSAASASRLLSGQLTAELWQYAKQHET